jgi:TrmH family RNA methyltransferase
VDPYHAKVIRASMGSIFHVPIEVDVPLESLVHRFRKIACLDLEGECLTDPQFAECDCYLFGNEARGVPRERLERLSPLRFNINGSGAIESLNLAAAVNMSVYELSRVR